jgi:hypothetical protein
LRCFNGFPSSGQLDIRVTVVSHVFDFVSILGKADCDNSSAVISGTCRLNGFRQRWMFAFMMSNAFLRVIVKSEDAAGGSRRANTCLLHGCSHEAQP